MAVAPLSTEKSQEAPLGSAFCRLIFKWLAAISDVGIELDQSHAALRGSRPENEISLGCWPIVPGQFGCSTAPKDRRRPILRSSYAEITGFFVSMFRRNRCDETILLGNETIFPLWCRYPETAVGYQTGQRNGRQRRQPNPETPDADRQLHPRLCLHPRRSVDCRFVFVRGFARHRYLRL
jgi:hypothetical protein